jgi:transposase
MGIIIDPECYKSLKCTECGSTKIANMLNEGVIRCLDCGKEKPDSNHWRNIMKKATGSGVVYTSKKNPNPHRDF